MPHYPEHQYSAKVLDCEIREVGDKATPMMTIFVDLEKDLETGETVMDEVKVDYFITDKTMDPVEGFVAERLRFIGFAGDFDTFKSIIGKEITVVNRHEDGYDRFDVKMPYKPQKKGTNVKTAKVLKTTFGKQFRNSKTRMVGEKPDSDVPY